MTWKLPVVILYRPISSWRYRLPARSLAQFRIGCDGGGYGCWFYVKLGTGVFVDPGRSKRFENKAQLYSWLKATVNTSEVQRTLRPCTDANRYHWNVTMTRAHPRGCDWHHTESGVCAAARKESFDSVVYQVPSRPAELVLCHEWCMHHVSCDECPPVMQNRSGQCACNNKVGKSNC